MRRLGDSSLSLALVIPSGQSQAVELISLTEHYRVLLLTNILKF